MEAEEMPWWQQDELGAEEMPGQQYWMRTSNYRRGTNYPRHNTCESLCREICSEIKKRY